MKKFLLILVLAPLFFFSQHENDNWVFGNSKWTFDNSTPNGFTHIFRNPYIRYISSVISDKNTGELLFYSNGYRVFNKNNVIMDNGDDLFGVVNGNLQAFGNPSDQSSIILPKPGSNKIYYLFYINGNRSTNDIEVGGSTNYYNYGLRYAIVDMSLNGGLGKVISKNNVLFTGSPVNALTSTFSSDGSSYWVVTSNSTQNQILSYKLDVNGVNMSPVVSNGIIGNFIKISPNGKKMATRVSNGLFLYDFDNLSGVFTNQINIQNNIIYNDHANSPNSLEFSPDSKIIYFISSSACLCLYPLPLITESGISMYNISTNTLAGVNNYGSYNFQLPSSNFSASMQLSKNGKIYLIYNAKLQNDGYGYYYVNIASNPLGVIDNPNQWNPNTNPLSQINPPINVQNGFSFPQLIPIHQPNLCQQNYVLETPETNNNYTYHASNSIITQTNYVNLDKTITFKAGNYIKFSPNTFLKPTGKNFIFAVIEPCEGEIGNPDPLGRNGIFQTNKSKNSKEVLNDIKVYPIPASTYINIDTGNESLNSWDLFDSSGRLIKSGSTSKILIENYNKGLYLIVIKTNKQKVSRKLIIN